MLKDYGWIIFILQGIGITMQYSLIAIFLGFFIGNIFAMMSISKSKSMQLVAKAYVSVFRGTPILLQLSIWYFVVPRFTGLNLSTFSAGVIAFSINSSAYIAEIVRAGINSIDKGQIEAAKTLGIDHTDTMLDIVIPQATRNILPALMNEMISLVKETAIIGVIGVHDLTRRAQLVAAEKYDYFGPMFVAAIGYYVLILLLTFIGTKTEKVLRRKY
jgi:His/Glu/Gln/Arg/opine family amino acid ABC transporter permease subunit